jgi:hypothetical protein
VTVAERASPSGADALNETISPQVKVYTDGGCKPNPGPGGWGAIIRWDDREWVLFHYRGCWGSEGAYVLRTIPDDVGAALDDLSSGLYPQVDPDRLVLVGHSLGGWAAVLAGAADPRVRAVAVYGAVSDPRSLPFTAADAADEFSPWLRGLTPESFAAQWAALGAEYAPVEQVARLAPRPLLTVHSRADEVVPVRQAEALFERTGEPRELVIHEEANHAFVWHRAWLRERILGWLGELDLSTERKRQ